MADLDVQPKKRTSWLPWLIGAIILIALLIFLFRTCNKTDAVASTTDSTSTSTNTTDTNANSTVGATTPAAMANNQSNWDSIDRNNAPAASYNEITNKDINVRGNDNYGIYSLSENILFETDKATIRKSAEQNLKQLAGSINQRFKGGDVRVYGYTDSVGSKGYNKDLAQQRAEAVRNWLSTNGGIDSSHISLNAIGEGSPVATNATAQGRQQNRRVEVIARKPQ